MVGEFYARDNGNIGINEYEAQYSLPKDEKPVESKPIEVAEVETAAEAAPEKTEEAPPCELLSSFLSIFNMLQLEIAPADFHFPTTNQTRHCLTRYIIIANILSSFRCTAAKGEDALECDKFAKFYRSLCPGEWIDRWNEPRENDIFPRPL
ncbi:cytochrome c oxidase subunit 6b-1-like [Chenopodium quinoa]|uniref:cytochrome c oxidase subunit 6b-1-like n=1 Tax=Chenopodium quinoa TaxID=63459 RepID=UPI000B780FC1|nr:cytochrome c oxidase subunit 6b-1-like [Chenopodium quinoa]